ncbi:DUF2971 domain-containing protein [Shewanella benthica]|uniref:DUF2971 domain-containing protein n=1 Tax=Shewanella benthica TaxID=43661 RepID=UPI00187A999A|nr:DUF2971 domain-containing protein [Shewanella benthica]MBE7214244.1 DUF2971 domain-containing protein [Shewanella benthica]MCL1062902.1 DUF2971 domain-containing protein [Shewanella benthica]
MDIKLYKYMPLRPDFFVNRWLRASTQTALNDPFEIIASDEYLIDMVMSLRTFKEKGRSRTRDEAIEFLKSSDSEGMDDAFFLNHGVISFTETRGNLLMWAHYAEQHQGMVIEFDSKHEFFSSKFVTKHNSHEGRLSRVLYRKERLASVNNYLMELYLHKSDEWAYEKEHRLILDLVTADKKLIHKDKVDFFSLVLNNDFKSKNLQYRDLIAIPEHQARSPYLLRHKDLLCMYEVPKGAIKSVTFGCNADESLIDTAREHLSNYDIQLQKTRIDSVDYRLRFEDL